MLAVVVRVWVRAGIVAGVDADVRACAYGCMGAVVLRDVGGFDVHDEALCNGISAGIDLGFLSFKRRCSCW